MEHFPDRAVAVAVVPQGIAKRRLRQGAVTVTPGKDHR
jgi:hypothetical protein